MKLINSIEDLNKHVVVASDFYQDKLLIFTNRVEREFKKSIGEAKYESIVSSDEDDDLRIIACSFVANKGLSLALPSLVLNITSAGVFTNATTDSQRAEWWQMKDLNRSLLKASFEALDEVYSEIGIDKIADVNDLYVKNLKQFEHVYSLGGSAQTFMSLIPFMREVQEQYIYNTLQNCIAHEFNDYQLKIIRAAIVNLALSKAATSGSFSIESNAMLLRFEVMPWEKVEKLEQQTLTNFKEDRFNIGMGYLHKVSQFIKDLPCYEKKEYQSDIQKLKSGLYL